MNKVNFLKMQRKAQEEIVLAEFPDFQMKAYEDTCFGIFFEVSDDEIEERIKYAEDYATFETLHYVVPGFNDQRASEISNGSPLTENEKKLLKNSIAEEHMDGWTGVHGWSKSCDDGDVFLVFWGHSEGQGGIQLQYARAFENEQKAREWFETFEVYTYM